jgi:branched chain amino acid efflux pump
MIIAILLTSAIAALARLLPFLFAERIKHSQWIQSVGRKLPPAIMVLLIAYTVSGQPFLTYPYGIPSIAGIVATAATHVWRKNMLLSILTGVVVYQTLIHTL